MIMIEMINILSHAYIVIIYEAGASFYDSFT